MPRAGLRFRKGKGSGIVGSASASAGVREPPFAGRRPGYQSGAGIPESVWQVLRRAVNGYISHGSLSRGAAISFYAVTSLAPVLLIVVAIAGQAFGEQAVRARWSGKSVVC